MDYFTSERISDRIIRIKDICDVFQYLVIGEEKACLLDTGSGFGNLREYVDQLTDKEYFVILTHGHVDHACGASQFEDKDIYMNPLDLDLLQRHMEFEVRKACGKMAPIVNQIPESDYAPKLSKTPLPLQDEQTFDLGGLSLEAIHAPGHTQGMTMILMKEEKTILFGDGCGVSVLLIDEDASSVEEYLQTLNKLKKYEDMYEHIIRNHGTGTSPKELLDNVIECCVSVIDGTDDKQKARNLPMECENAFFARKLQEGSIKRVDGKEGNIAYRADKVLKKHT